MNLNRQPTEWAHVKPDAFLTGSNVQARNVLEMALQDIARLSAEVERLSSDPTITKRLLEWMAGLPDEQAWALACTFVGVAGMRAQQIERKDIDDLCAAFVQGMTTLAGTPKLEMVDD